MERNLSALIIDDDSDLSYLLSEVFRSKHIEASVASTLGEAKIAINNKIPTFVVLDNTLPDGYGVDFLEYLNSNFKNCKVIFITGDYENDNEYTHTGINQLIRKPFSIAAFRSVLDSVL